VAHRRVGGTYDSRRTPFLEPFPFDCGQVLRAVPGPRVNASFDRAEVAVFAGSVQSVRPVGNVAVSGTVIRSSVQPKGLQSQEDQESNHQKDRKDPDDAVSGCLCLRLAGTVPPIHGNEYRA
jgi:hypothetical protein